MKRTRPLPAPNTLQPGHYIFWQQRTYQVVALDPDNACPTPSRRTRDHPELD